MNAPTLETKRVCPLLERETATVALDIAPAPWVVRRCTETDFVFLENPPGYESLQSEFAWEETWQREAERRSAAEPTLYAISSTAKSFRRRVMKRNKVADIATAVVARCASPTIRLLDLGCGEGELLGTVMQRLPDQLRQRCVPHGVEISNQLALRSQQALQRHGGQCVHASAIEGLGGFADHFFDLIVMSGFLEHEIHPLPLLREARRSLRDDGHLLVKVPNYACWNRTVRGRRWCGFRWPEHVNYFTPKSLTTIARSAGFSVERMNLLDRFPLSDSLYAVLQPTRA